MGRRTQTSPLTLGQGSIIELTLLKLRSYLNEVMIRPRSLVSFSLSLNRVQRHQKQKPIGGVSLSSEVAYLALKSSVSTRRRLEALASPRRSCTTIQEEEGSALTSFARAFLDLAQWIRIGGARPMKRDRGSSCGDSPTGQRWQVATAVDAERWCLRVLRVRSEEMRQERLRCEGAAESKLATDYRPRTLCLLFSSLGQLAT